jgi:hypothetical protein
MLKCREDDNGKWRSVSHSIICRGRWFAEFLVFVQAMCGPIPERLFFFIA